MKIMGKDLWVYYSKDGIDTELDRKIRAIVEVTGGRWYGSGMCLVGRDRNDRDNSFQFQSADSFEKALDALGEQFQITHMHDVEHADHKTAHYRIEDRS